MNTREEVENFVAMTMDTPILDVRSPGEYAKGHIPGAISFPLFSNQERAEVGTLYKQVGQAAAIDRGMALVQPKVQEMFRTGVAYANDGKLLVHCWRGGKRSEAVAGLLAVSGLDVRVLEGGYKAYRNWVLQQFERKYDLKIVGGGTGTGKTKVLHTLRDAGECILDLEAMADHRGSAFGRLGARETVTFTQFENRIAMALAQMRGKTIWVEDESRTLGSLYIPAAFWQQMRMAPTCYIDLPLAVRKELLLADYGSFDKLALTQAVEKIRRRLGGLRTNQVLQGLAADDADQVIEILLDYYDKSYKHTSQPRPAGTTYQLSCTHFDAAMIATKLMAMDF